MEVFGRPSVRERRSGGTKTKTHITARMTNTKGVTLRAYLLDRRPYLAPPRAWRMVETFSSVHAQQAGATRRTLRFYYGTARPSSRGHVRPAQQHHSPKAFLAER